MRTISILDDISVLVTQYVRALPDIFTEFDMDRVSLVETALGEWDIIVTEDDEEETLIGQATVDKEFNLLVDVFPE